jgi:hypothetical protein
MARFIMLAAMAGEPDGGGYRKFAALTTISDTIGNAQYGDVVWAALCQAPSGANLAPLDSAASALMGGVPIVTVNAPGGYGGAAGQNAGA